MSDVDPIPPASSDMAVKLAVNRTGRLTPAQRRVALVAGLGALLLMLCPVALLIQMGAVLLVGDTPVPALGGVIVTGIAALLVLLFAGLVGANAGTFLPEAFMRRPVKVARGPLEIRMTAGHRPELPFSYLVAGYSFAPYVAPPDVALRVGAPYLVYYSARSRLLLSMVALDAPDAAQWEPGFER
jgi:hypothetical protein